MFRRTAAWLIALALGFTTAGSGQAMDGPETVVYDSLRNRHLVSCMISGDILMIDSIGNCEVFYTLLSDIHGMTIVGNTLYYTGDLGSQGGVVGVDLDTQEKVFELLYPNWFNSLNGITADTSGNLYVASTGESRIYKVDLETQNTEIFSYGVSIPNALHYDVLNNRLLAASDEWWTPVYAIDMITQTVSPVTTVTGQFSGIAEDALHNYYISFFNRYYVYKFDSDFQNEERIVEGLNGPEGICYDNLHSQLCIPVLMSDRVDFLPLEVDAWMDPAVSVGWAPMEIDFSGVSVFEIAEWKWDFGDGQAATGQIPSHLYEIPGLYNIRLDAVTTTGDTITHVFPRRVCNLADTIWADSFELDPDSEYIGQHFEITIYAKNSIPLNRMTIPIEYSGELILVLDTFSTVGCRTEHFEVQSRYANSSTNKRMAFNFRPKEYMPQYMEPGSGPILKLSFHTYGAVGEEAYIQLDGYLDSYLPTFFGNGVDYAPVQKSGFIRFRVECGDANDDGTPNVGDAVFIINYVYKGGAAPNPIEAGDANCDGDCNVGDAVYLINYVFKGGSEPCSGCK